MKLSGKCHPFYCLSAGGQNQPVGENEKPLICQAAQRALILSETQAALPMERTKDITRANKGGR
jgi:hypothetical protein